MFNIVHLPLNKTINEHIYSSLHLCIRRGYPHCIGYLRNISFRAPSRTASLRLHEVFNSELNSSVEFTVIFHLIRIVKCLHSVFKALLRIKMSYSELDVSRKRSNCHMQ